MVCIVIPVHNRKKFTRDCLLSLQNQTLPADYIIVVNDGSTDGTSEMIEQEFPGVIILNGNGKLFWTAAINMGVRLALHMEADHVMTLNNDTIASKDFIERMVTSATQKPRAILGALDVDWLSKRPYYGGEIFNWRSGSSKYLLNLLKKEDQKG